MPTLFAATEVKEGKFFRFLRRAFSLDPDKFSLYELYLELVAKVTQ